MRRIVLLGVVAFALAAAAGATGYSFGKSVNVRKGDSAVFLPSHWQCNNHGGRVECFSGDAYPWAELTGANRGGVTVRVHTLSGGGVRVRAVRHPRVQELHPYDEIIYTFSAF